LFQQEYPISAAEAFVMSGSNGFIPPAIVVTARKAKGIQAGGPLVVGVDPAGSGGDRIAFAWRRGRAVEKVETKRGLDTMGIVGEVVSIVQRDRPAAVFIDATGLGQGVYDRAREMVGYAVAAVHFASKPFRPQPVDEQLRPTGGPLNRR